MELIHNKINYIYLHPENHIKQTLYDKIKETDSNTKR